MFLAIPIELDFTHKIENNNLVISSKATFVNDEFEKTNLNFYYKLYTGHKLEQIIIKEEDINVLLTNKKYEFKILEINELMNDDQIYYSFDFRVKNLSPTYEIVFEPSFILKIL